MIRPAVLALVVAGLVAVFPTGDVVAQTGPVLFENARLIPGDGSTAIEIWVDDRNGRAPKLAPALYRVVINEAHARGYRVSAHVFYHDDAVDLAEQLEWQAMVEAGMFIDGVEIDRASLMGR